MSKELPYFRFTVQDWQNGKISLESYKLKGLFIEICGYYWINDCSITLTMLQKKFRDATELLKELIELGIIKHENRHDKVEIEFLNIQYDLLSENRKLRQIAGSKGGKAKAMLKQKDAYKDKDKDKDKRITLPFSSNEFLNIWETLLKQPKWKKKTEHALKLSLEKLKPHTEQVAIEMIKNTIAGGWQGIFELDDKKINKSINKPGPLDLLKAYEITVKNQENESINNS